MYITKWENFYNHVQVFSNSKTLEVLVPRFFLRALDFTRHSHTRINPRGSLKFCICYCFIQWSQTRQALVCSTFDPGLYLPNTGIKSDWKLLVCPQAGVTALINELCPSRNRHVAARIALRDEEGQRYQGHPSKLEADRPRGECGIRSWKTVSTFLF